MDIGGWHLLILLAIALIVAGGLHLPARPRQEAIRVRARRRHSFWR